jgi:Ion channel
MTGTTEDSSISVQLHAEERPGVGTVRSLGWSIGGQVRAVFSSRDRYGLVFVLVLADYVLMVASPSTRWTGLDPTLPVAATVLFTLHTSNARRSVLRFAQFAIVLCAVVGVIQGVWNEGAMVGIPFLLLALLLVATPIAIVRRVLTHTRVNLETIFAALSVYVVIGLIFGQLFIGISHIATNPPFLAQTRHATPSDCVYLSFVTLTTVGFGDLTPRTELARSVVVLEALIGQVFLITLVARLVAMFGIEMPHRGTMRHRDTQQSDDHATPRDETKTVAVDLNEPRTAPEGDS